MLKSIIYSLYELSQTFIQNGLELSNGYSAMAIGMLSAFVVGYFALFLFKGFGVYTLSLRQGLSTPWLAFVPFASYVQTGKLIGKCKIFRIETKNFGLWLLISSLVLFAVDLTYDLAFCLKDFLFIVSQDKLPVVITSMIENPDLFQFLLEIFSIIFELVNFVLFIFFVALFFRFYGGKHTLAYTLLSIFFSDLFGIFIFVCRKNDKKDYEVERMRRFAERMGSDNYGPFGGRRNDGYDNNGSASSNPFGEFNGDTQKTDAQGTDDVFSEYPDKKNSSDKTNNDDGDLF